jgi:hypothetical protein
MTSLRPPKEGQSVWLADWHYALFFVILSQPGVAWNRYNYLERIYGLIGRTSKGERRLLLPLPTTSIFLF